MTCNRTCDHFFQSSLKFNLKNVGEGGEKSTRVHDGRRTTLQTKNTNSMQDRSGGVREGGESFNSDRPQDPLARGYGNDDGELNVSSEMQFSTLASSSSEVAGNHEWFQRERPQ